MQHETPASAADGQSSEIAASFASDVLNSLMAHVAVLDPSGVIVAVNEAWRHFAQANKCADPAFYVGSNYLEACEEAVRRSAEPMAATALAGIRAVLQGEQSAFSLEYPCHSPHEQRWFVLRVTRLSHASPTRVVVSHEEITGQKKIESALREAERTLRQVLELLPVGVWIMDRTGRITLGNRAAQQIWGGARYVTPDQFGEYRAWWAGTGKAIAAEEWAAARALRKGETSLNEEIRIACFDGTTKAILNSAIPLLDDEQKIVGAIIVNQDITARKHQEKELERTRETLEVANRELREALAREQLLARTDSLTGLYNRRHFFELASRECAMAKRHATPLSAMLIDIDHFKQVNDTAGHQRGDEILRRVGQLALECLRETDILARYGGEEFIAVLPGSTARQAAVVAERMRERVGAGAVSALAAQVTTTISIGVAELTSTEETLDQLIRRADAALYCAKDRGRNRTVIDSSVEAA